MHVLQKWHLVSERTLGLMNACTEISLHGVNIISNCFEACAWCPKISSSRSLCKGIIWYPANNEDIYGIVPYIINFFIAIMLHQLLLKRKIQHVSHKWVTSRLLCGSVGQQVQPTFNPGLQCVATYRLACPCYIARCNCFNSLSQLIQHH